VSKLVNDKDLMKRIFDKLDQLDSKVDTKFDRVEERLDSLDQTMTRNTSSLQEHMRRTELLEKAQEEMKPIKTVYTVAWGLVKVVGAIGVLLGLVASVLKFLF
jgi:uncharacterized protein YdcH (DUF465 family)